MTTTAVESGTLPTPNKPQKTRSRVGTREHPWSVVARDVIHEAMSSESFVFGKVVEILKIQGG